jgi:polar amino acid transport system substrate-binding protein
LPWLLAIVGFASLVGLAQWLEGPSASDPSALRWGGDRTGGGPYIYKDRQGNLVGFEVELADYLGRELGRRAEFVQGPWDKLPDRMDRGDSDIVLNGYEWSRERERKWSSTIPYYIYRVVLLARKDDDSLRSWDDLRASAGRRRKVGVLSGSAAHRYLEEHFGDDIDILAYTEGVTSAMRLVEQRQLDATVQDLPASVYYRPKFPGLHPVGEPRAPGYYVIYVRKGDAALREQLNAALRQALQDGTLRRIYQQYGVWTPEQENIAQAAENWPPASEADEEEGDNGLAFNWSDFWQQWLLLLRAAVTTVLLACLSMPLAMLVGLLVAVGRLYGPAAVRWPLTGYVEFLRGTPLLLQLFVIFFLLPAVGVRIPAFWAGVLGLAINYSAYEAENYRAGLLAIPRGQMEAALALGMSKAAALRHVIVPQAVRIVIPPVTNDFIALFKDTSVCSVIAVTELTGRYNELYNNHPREVLQLGIMTAVLYLLMSYPLSLVARRLEQRFPKVVV